MLHLTANGAGALQAARRTGNTTLEPANIEATGQSRWRLRLWRRQYSGGARRVPWLFALPSVAFLVAFHYVAPLSSVYYAFTDWNGAATPHWIGFANFKSIITTGNERGPLIHTLELAGAFVVLVNVIGLSLALSLNRTLKARNFLRSLFFVPFVLSPLATAYIWQYIFTYDGALNRFFNAAGLHSWVHLWLADPNWALWTILVVLVWQFSGLSMIIYLAGLQGVPAELDEASAVDGATTTYRLRKVTLPLLAPAITVSGTLTLIFGLRVFDQVLAMTNGGPIGPNGGATQTLATELYQQTFVYGRFGYGAALAVILSLLIAVLAITQTIILRARERRLT
jgi:raffinose/stachyose/melibiose transport system permease protein